MSFLKHSQNRNSTISTVSARTNQKVNQIKKLLGQALGEVKNNLKRSPSPTSSKRQSEESSECEEIQEVLANLQKGYLMVKHSLKITQPHDKFIYLSEDHRFLCWKSIDKQDQKRIQITQIDSVIKDGCEFYIKSDSIKDISRCVVVITPSRKLQLEAPSEIQADYFAYQLKRIVKYWKGMRLNYKYNKK